jgi:hypothetical protein
VWYNYDQCHWGRSIAIYNNGDYYSAGENATHIGEWDTGWLIHEPEIKDHSAPIKPATPQGKTNIKYGVEYPYTTSTIDPDGDNIKYCFLWGYEGFWFENEVTWTDWVPSGQEVTVTHTWYEDEEIWEDKPIIQVLAVDDSSHNLESEYSDLMIVCTSTSVGCITGTKITMAPGYAVDTKPIEEIVIGDVILSYDQVNGCITSAEVVHVYEFTHNLTENYTDFNSKVQIDSDNSIFINMSEWKKASDALVGDYMLENIPGTPDVFQTPIFQKDQKPIGKTTFYKLVTSPLEGNASGYWANGILVNGE